MRSIIGYPGEMNPEKIIHLIILVGFEHERAKAIIEQVEPTIISIGYGAKEKSIREEHYVVNKHFENLVYESIAVYGNVNEFKFSCEDSIMTKEAIIKEIEKGKHQNVIIAPMNTKISSLGASMVGDEMREVRIIYLEPRQYNVNRYSVPDDRFYVIRELL